MGAFIEKNCGTIALIVAIIALVSSLVPQINDFMKDGNKTEVVGIAVPGGHGGQGRPAGGPAGGPGGRGGFFGASQPSEEYLKLYDERLALYDEALKTAQEPDSLKLRVERDCAKLMKLRRESGARRVAAGASEAFLKLCATVNCPKATALDKNQAQLDYQQALDRIRGDKELFINTVEAFKGYPSKILTDGDLNAMLAAEQQAPAAP